MYWVISTKETHSKSFEVAEQHLLYNLDSILKRVSILNGKLDKDDLFEILITLNGIEFLMFLNYHGLLLWFLPYRQTKGELEIV